MGIVTFTRPTGDESPRDLADLIAKLQKQVEFLMNGNVSSKNIREAGGWLIDDDRIVSKDEDVGMSTADTGGDDVRFWAGDANPESAPFNVRKSGKASLTGASIVSKNAYPKIELSSEEDLLRASASPSSYIEIEALSEYDNTAIKLANGSTLGYFEAAVGAVNLLTAAGNININASGYLFLHGNQVVVDGWSRVFSVSESETLADVFDYYDTMISYLIGSMSSLITRISNLENAGF